MYAATRTKSTTKKAPKVTVTPSVTKSHPSSYFGTGSKSPSRVYITPTAVPSPTNGSSHSHSYRQDVTKSVSRHSKSKRHAKPSSKHSKSSQHAMKSPPVTYHNYATMLADDIDSDDDVGCGTGTPTSSALLTIERLPYSPCSTSKWIVQHFCDGWHFFYLHPKTLDDWFNRMYGSTSIDKLLPYTPIEAIEKLGETTYRSNVKTLIELHCVLQCIHAQLKHNIPLPWNIIKYFELRGDMYATSEVQFLELVDGDSQHQSFKHSLHKNPPPSYSAVSPHVRSLKPS